MNGGFLYPTDLFSLMVAAFFALCSFLNAGKLTVRVAGLTLDREILCGLVFLLLIPGLLLLFRLTNRSVSRPVRFVRLFYPQLLHILYFQECIILSQLFFAGAALDAIFARTDYLLFGFQPSIRFHLALSFQPLVTELFFFGYFSHFGLITIGWWVLYFKGRIQEAAEALTLVIAAGYLLCLFYVFFPVQGPKYFFPELHSLWYGHFKGYLFTFLLQNMFNSMNLAGAAFPSTHVAVSLQALFLNRRLNPRLFPVFLPLTALLALSTIFLYAHYFVDVLGGWLAGALFYFLLPKAIRLLQPALARMEAALARGCGLQRLADLEALKAR